MVKMFVKIYFIIFSPISKIGGEFLNVEILSISCTFDSVHKRIYELVINIGN